MPISFSFFDILLIIGISQGLVTSCLLLVNKEKESSDSTSKHILGLTVLVFCIVNCKVLLHSTGLWNVPEFRYFPVGMELLLPPLVYLYILSLTETQFTFQKKHLAHLAPGIVYALYDTTVYLATVGEPDLQAKLTISSALYFDQSNILEDYLIVILSLVYVCLGFIRIKHYVNWLKQFKDYRSLAIYKWLRSLVLWSMLLGVVLTINQLLTSLSLAMEEPMYRWRFFNLLIAFATYYIGFMGYKNDSLKIHTSKKSLNSLSNKLNAEEALALEAQLLAKFEKDNIYLDGELTQKQLAEELSVSSESISIIVNQKFGINFRDLVNRYRINHVKQLLNDQHNNHSSILDMALAAGFNSQASFYRVFKKAEGMSPKEYLATLESDHR